MKTNPKDIEQEASKVPPLIRSHISNWVTAGLIDTPLAQKLLEYSADHSTRPHRNLFGVIVSAIAGLFILTGSILIIAENWQEVPRLVKLLGSLGMFAGFQYAGFRWKHHADSIRRGLAEGFLLVGGGMIMGTIALVSQIYNLDSRPASGVLLWFALLLPLPWLTRSSFLWLMTLGAMTTWLGMEFHQPDSLLHTKNSTGSIALWSMLGLLLWSIAEWRQFIFHPKATGLARFVGAAIFLGGTLILGFDAGYTHHVAVDHRPAIILFFIFSLGMWIAARVFSSKNRLQLMDLVLLALWIETIAIQFIFRPWWEPVIWGTHISLCIFLIRDGANEGRTSWINIGILFVLISTLARYFDFFGNYLSGGAFFIVTGAFLFGLVWILEKQRRRWVSKARGKASL